MKKIITVLIFFLYESGNWSIHGYLMERDPSTLDILKHPTTVSLGGPSLAVSGGQDITIGLAVVEQEIWYYTSECDYLVKVQPIEQVEFSNYPGVFIIVGPPAGYVGDITATVSNVFIIYP